MGNTPSIEGKETFIQSKYGVNPDRIKVIKGQYYFTLDREKYKLPKEVLKTFEYTNDFSKEKDNDAPPVEQNKKLYNMKFH
jgi:hypothetical protein